MIRSFQILIACSLGGGIGAFVALQFNSYFWWLGLIAGGLTGYIIYDFKEVVNMACRAWQMAKNQIPKSEAVALGLFATSLLFSFGVLCLLCFSVYSAGLMTERAAEKFILTPGILFLIICVISSFARLIRRKDEVGDASLFLRRMAFWTSPPAVFFYYPVWITYFSCKYSVKFGRKFASNAFYLIHSDIRLLCMQDAAIGAGIGYWWGSALVGALAGGLIGVFDFEIISRWVLKLVPAK